EGKQLARGAAGVVAARIAVTADQWGRGGVVVLDELEQGSAFARVPGPAEAIALGDDLLLAEAECRDHGIAAWRGAREPDERVGGAVHIEDRQRLRRHVLAHERAVLQRARTV